MVILMVDDYNDGGDDGRNGDYVASCDDDLMIAMVMMRCKNYLYAASCGDDNDSAGDVEHANDDVDDNVA